MNDFVHLDRVQHFLQTDLNFLSVIWHADIRRAPEEILY